MKILITGGTGLIGQAVIPELLKSEHQVVLFTRDRNKAKHCFAPPFPRLNDIVDDLHEVDFNKIDAVINLAGEPIVNKRWSNDQKRKLCASRWDITELIAQKISAAENPPSVFISGSAIGIYGRQGERHIDEGFTGYYPEFSSKLCLKWEQIALKAQSEHTRVCLLRTGIVLSDKGGALEKMLPPFKIGLGGPIGNGKQAMSWIHIQDMVRLIMFLLSKSELHGAFNATAPNPVTNKVLSKSLAKSLKRPCIFPVPAFVLKLAMGEMSDLLLYGQYVYPKKLLDAGFQFCYTEIDEVFSQLFSKQND